MDSACKQVFYDFITKYADIFFVEKNASSFCIAKASHIFFNKKNIGVFQILTFEITKH